MESPSPTSPRKRRARRPPERWLEIGVFKQRPANSRPLLLWVEEPMSKLSDLLADLGTRGPVRHVGESSWRCRCPAHADKNGSLYVSAGDGRILVYCHGGCDYRSILAALDLTQAALFDEEVGADGKFEVKRLRRPLPMAEADRRASAYALLTEALVLLDED